MNRSAGLLSALYLATSTGLAWTAVLALRQGPPWIACLFAAASLVPVIAVVRESVLRDQRRALAEMRGRVVHLEIVVRNPEKVSVDRRPYSEWKVDDAFGITYRTPDSGG